MTGSYRRAERIGIALGLAELVFIPAVAMAHPNLSAIAQGPRSVCRSTTARTCSCSAANVGAVIMPWMIFYQQGAVLDKGLKPAEHLERAARHRRRRRTDPADHDRGGARLRCHRRAVPIPGVTLHTVGEMSSSLRPFVGAIGAKVLLGTAVLGAALVAALVASLAGAWGIAEVFGWAHTLNERPDRNTAKFYLTYGFAHVLGAGHRALQLEPRPPRDRRGSHERHHAADRARLPAGSRSTGACRPSTACTGCRRVVTTGLCFVVIGLRALPGAGDARMDLELCSHRRPRPGHGRRAARPLRAGRSVLGSVSVHADRRCLLRARLLRGGAALHGRSRRAVLPASGSRRPSRVTSRARARSRCFRCAPRTAAQATSPSNGSRDRCTAGREASPCCTSAPWPGEIQWARWPVVPGSGTGDLARISGEGRIEISTEGAHELHLDYELS